MYISPLTYAQNSFERYVLCEKRNCIKSYCFCFVIVFTSSVAGFAIVKNYIFLTRTRCYYSHSYFVCVCLTHFNGFTTYTLAFMSAVMYASSNIPSISIFSIHVRIRFTVFALCFVLCCVSLLSLSSSSSSLFAPSLLSMLCFIAQHTVCFCFQLFPSLKWLLVERTLRSESVLSKQSAVGNQ